MLIVGALTVLAICVFAQNSAKDPAKLKMQIQKTMMDNIKYTCPNAHWCSEE